MSAHHRTDSRLPALVWRTGLTTRQTPGMWMLSTATRLLDATQRALGVRADSWALWRAASGGDPQSARRLVQQLTPTALTLARQMLGRQEDAEDVVQESFLRLWSARPSDDAGAQLATYFHTIVLNRCRSHLVRQRELSLGPDELTALHDRHQQEAEAPASDGPGTDPARLQAALGALPARQRMALAMWAYADAQAPEIATALDIDTNAAHQLLFRAKRSLRERLQEAQP